MRRQRASVARRLFKTAEFEIGGVDEVVRSIDPGAFMARHR